MFGIHVGTKEKRRRKLKEAGERRRIFLAHKKNKEKKAEKVGRAASSTMLYTPQRQRFEDWQAESSGCTDKQNERNSYGSSCVFAEYIFIIYLSDLVFLLVKYIRKKSESMRDQVK